MHILWLICMYVCMYAIVSSTSGRGMVARALSTLLPPPPLTNASKVVQSNARKYILENDECRILRSDINSNNLDIHCENAHKGTVRGATLNILDAMQTVGEATRHTLTSTVECESVPMIDDIMNILVATPLVHHAKYSDRDNDEGTFVYRSGRQLSQSVHLHNLREQLQNEQRRYIYNIY